jgi:hypothetical protein
MLEGFWPFNNWKANSKCASICIVFHVDLEDLVIFPYYGPKNMHPSLNIVTHMFFCDLFVSNFVFVRPSNLQFILFGWEGPKVML